MRWLKTRRKPSSAWVVFNILEWVSTYLSLNVYIGLNGYTPRYLAEFLPIIVVYPPKIVEKSELLLKSLVTRVPRAMEFFVYHAQFLFGHVGNFGSLAKSINYEVEKTWWIIGTTFLNARVESFTSNNISDVWEKQTLVPRIICYRLCWQQSLTHPKNKCPTLSWLDASWGLAEPRGEQL